MVNYQELKNGLEVLDLLEITPKSLAEKFAQWHFFVKSESKITLADMFKEENKFSDLYFNRKFFDLAAHLASKQPQPQEEKNILAVNQYVSLFVFVLDYVVNIPVDHEKAFKYNCLVGQIQKVVYSLDRFINNRLSTDSLWLELNFNPIASNTHISKASNTATKINTSISFADRLTALKQQKEEALKKQVQEDKNIVKLAEIEKEETAPTATATPTVAQFKQKHLNQNQKQVKINA